MTVLNIDDSRLSTKHAQILSAFLQQCKRMHTEPENVVEGLDDSKLANFLRGIVNQVACKKHLKTLLDSNIWSVETPNDNAQAGDEDRDVLVTHLPSQTAFRVEVKSIDRGSNGRGTLLFRADGLSVKVKNIRSRNADNKPDQKDRYRRDHSELICVNLFNAVIDKGSHDFRLLEGRKAQREIPALVKFLGLPPDADAETVMNVAANTWFFALYGDLPSKDGEFTDRAPLIILVPNPQTQLGFFDPPPCIWQRTGQIEATLLDMLPKLNKAA